MNAPLILSLQDIAVTFGNRALFRDLTFHIQEGNKIALVGRNGAGKSTVMDLITGRREPDAGTRFQLEGTVIGYLQQEIVPKPGQRVYDYVFEQLPADEAYLHEYKIDMVLAPLELDVNALMETLSGGQLRRAALARALVEEPDILLLDEPTNHLDLHVIEWLETYLKSYKGTFLCVSHDKAFLAAVTNRIFWLDRGKMRVCPKGFGEFDEWSAQLIENEERELRKRQKTVEIEIEWAMRGVKARRKRNVRRLELMKEARDRLRADKHSFNRMMSRIEIGTPEIPEATSKIIAEFYNVGKVFENGGETTAILNRFNLRIVRGDRIGVIGRNGSGKTSFLRLLTGEIAPDAGKIKRAKDLVFSYFDQKRVDLDPMKTLSQILCPQGGDYIDVAGKQRHVAGYLKDFMFDPSRMNDKVMTLSGGQKNRLMLARILANPGSFLILDEPTNDLDMDTLEMLEEILSAYEGTLLIVSHDRDFLDQTVSKILSFEGNAVVDGYIGGYSDYAEARRRKQAGDAGDSPPSGEEALEKGRRNPAGGAGKAVKAQESDVAPESGRRPSPPGAKMSYKMRYELEQLPGKIARLEEEIASIRSQLSDPGLYARDAALFTNLSRRLGEAQDELASCEDRWLELEEMKAGSR